MIYSNGNTSKSLIKKYTALTCVIQRNINFMGKGDMLYFFFALFRLSDSIKNRNAKSYTITDKVNIKHPSQLIRFAAEMHVTTLYM